MRSPNHPDERDLDVAGLRRATPQMTSVKKGHGGRRGKTGIRRYVLGGLVALVLALFIGVVWFAYQDLMPGGDEAPPLIRADASPIKREPDERGGLPLVNEESAVVQALDEPDSPVRVERIMPRESTAPRSTADVIPEALEAEPASDTDPAAPAPDQAGAVTADAGTGAAAVEGDSLDSLLAEIVDGPGAVAVVEPATGAATAEPSDLAADELPLPADGIALPEGELAAPSAVTPPAPAPAAPPTSVATPVPPVPAVSAPAPASPPPAAAPPQVATAPASPSATGATPPAAPVPAAAAPADTTVAALPPPNLAADFRGAFSVQLLAVRDEAAAAGAWVGLQRQHPTVLGALRSRVQRAEIGGNTFFRLQAGPFADRASALAVCSALQARATDCFIVEPTS